MNCCESSYMHTEYNTVFTVVCHFLRSWKVVILHTVCVLFQASYFLHYLVLGPLEALAALGLLWREIGASSLAGMGLLLLLVPVQIKMGHFLMGLRLALYANGTCYCNRIIIF